MKKIWNIRVRISIFRHMAAAYLYDARRYLKFSTEVNIEKFSEQRLIGYIIARYHIIEKGLSMPEMRCGFGHQVVASLIHSCKIYIAKFGTNDLQIISAITTLKRYLISHMKRGQSVDSSFSEEIERLTGIVGLTDDSFQSHELACKAFFQNTESPFGTFAKSRHSVRSFSGESIPVDRIMKAIKLAQTTPTSCNRQPVRIRLITDKDLMAKILQIQTGNRGFGSSADKLVVLTVELGIYNEVRERNLCYIDAGLYAMNLLYALHYYKIGTCALNWSAYIQEDQKLRYLLELPDSEIVVLLFLCGMPSDMFTIASSDRRKGEEITIIYP